MERKRLYKKRAVMIDGVCGGIADYLNIDVTLVRLIWVATVLFAGTGVLAYIICCFVIPREPDYVDYTRNEYNDREN